MVAPRGSAVLFDGHLFHRGVMGADAAVLRHVLATHYVARGLGTGGQQQAQTPQRARASEGGRAADAEWPHVLWERLDFDGATSRMSTGDESTDAARVNARLPQHPGMAHIADRPSLLPCRRDAPLQILSPAQRDEMDLLGFTVLEDAFGPQLMEELEAEIDRLEAAANPLDGPASGLSGPQPPGAAAGAKVERTRSGARIDSISDATAITFTAHLVLQSAVARAFCGSEVFQKIVHDVLNQPDCRLYTDQAVYKKPCPGRRFPFHQDNGYVFIEPLQYLTCWVALNDATAENGCPWFIPALHRRGPIDHVSLPVLCPPRPFLSFLEPNPVRSCRGTWDHLVPCPFRHYLPRLSPRNVCITLRNKKRDSPLADSIERFGRTSTRPTRAGRSWGCGRTTPCACRCAEARSRCFGR